MNRRLGLRAGQVRVVANGINVAGFATAERPPNPPVLGFFARMCREKGLDTLVEAYLLLKQRPARRALRLHVGGGCGPADEAFVQQLKHKLAAAGALPDTQFFPNVDHAAKLAFYRGLSVFSTPALYGEAFGLYLLEALAAGVPVVQPRHAAFPEIVEATGGGMLCAPGDPKALADAIEGLLGEPAAAQRLGQRGRDKVLRDFTMAGMAGHFIAAIEPLLASPVPRANRKS